MNPNPLRGRNRAALFSLWTLLGLFSATKLVMERRLLGYGYSWSKALWWQLMEWYIWGALACIVFWLCRRFYRADKLWTPYVLIHLFAGFLLSVIQGFVCTVGGMIESWALGWPLTPVGDPYSFTTALRFTVLNHLHFNLMVYVGLVIGWHASRHYQDLRVRELKSAALEARLAEAQLRVLKTQLQPHFLFNTLNTIAELVHADPGGAEQMLLHLADLLRLTVQSGAAQEISLEQEIGFLKKYLEIQHVRLGDRLTVEWDVAPETLAAKVPNLILQPLVENAIRHGISPFVKPGRMRIQTRSEKGLLHLQVRDNGPGRSKGKSNDGEGVGLANTKSRLFHLYGEKQQMEFSNDDGFVVDVSLPFSPMFS